MAALMAAGIDPIGNVRLCLDGRARVWIGADPPAVHLSTPHGGISLTLDANDPGAAVVVVELADSIATLAENLLSAGAEAERVARNVGIQGAPEPRFAREVGRTGVDRGSW